TGTQTNVQRQAGALALGVTGLRGKTDGSMIGANNPSAYPVGADGPQMGAIVDGLSKTICLIEDVGRVEGLGTPKYDDPAGVTTYTGGKRAAWRWAEPDTANGVSGPPNGLYVGGHVINQNKKPFGGPSTAFTAGGGYDGTACPWNANNCGPNDEPFSFHGPG